MHDFLISHQASFRFGIFMAMLGTMMVLELFFSRRVSSLSKQKRWGTNFSIVLTDVVVVRLLFPVAVVEIAMLVQAQGMGLMNNLNMVLSAKFFLSIVLLDLLIYLQHVLRVHRVHHTDLEIDSTTGIRFHPLEIILSMLIKMLGIAILGPPVIAVIVYEIARCTPCTPFYITQGD
jgi:sterol desaturase/sphingolipid hydroxylase (fatty acid hydroxylase superfamily)